jgi:hypothetical protein
MHILFSNNVQVPINLNNSILQPTILGIFKNLQHVDIPFRAWDNPEYIDTMSYNQLIDRLVEFASRVSINIDRQCCLNSDQTYFNHIHKLYEEGYDGKSAWHDFHEHIHLCELYYKNRRPRLSIDYREKGGPLEKKFNMDWLSDSTTEIKTGNVYLDWSELGKTPYTYWGNQESTDIDRVCQLAKPWTKLQPKLQIALNNENMLANRKIAEFESWWSAYDERWCRHWQIPKWTIIDQYSVIVIGQIDSINTVVDLLKQEIYPVKVQL